MKYLTNALINAAVSCKWGVASRCDVKHQTLKLKKFGQC